MKIILLADVEKLGSLGELVIVKKGYGRNYLIPKGLALLASQANIKIFEQQKRKYQIRMEELRSNASDISEKLQGFMLAIPVRSGENNKLYGSVTTHMISDALLEHGFSIDRRKILLDTPIRTLGDFLVKVRLHANIIAEFIVSVISDRNEYVDEELITEEESRSEEELEKIIELNNEE
ncbi:MAG: 50S ribosomal protein L9 [Desulfovibrionaceae bacterium]